MNQKHNNHNKDHKFPPNNRPNELYITNDKDVNNSLSNLNCESDKGQSLLDDENNRKNNWGKMLIIMLLIGFTIFFLIQFFTSLDYANIKNSFQTTSIWMVFIAFALYLLMNLVRTIRLYEIFDRQVPVIRLFVINSSYNALNHMLPYRIGELSLPIFMKREDHKGFPVNSTIGSLIYMRIFDFLVSSIFLLIYTLLIYDLLYHPIVYLIAAIIVTGISIGLILFLLLLEKMPRILSNLENHFHNHLILKIISAVKEVTNNLILIKKHFNHLKYLGYACLIRLIQILITIAVFKMINIPLPIHIMIINDLFIAFVELIPLSLIANFGYYEYSYSTLLDLEEIDMPNHSNYNISFFRHFYNFIFIFGYYIIGILIRSYYHYMRKRKE